MLSSDLHLAMAPGRTYSNPTAHGLVAPWRSVLARLAFQMVLVGLTLSIAATGDVSAGLVATTTATATLAILAQLTAALTIVAVSSQRRAGVIRCLDLFFAGHFPWSLWMLLVSAIAAFSPGRVDPVGLGGATAAAVWTCIIVAAFCRGVLGTTRVGAYLRTALHQSIVLAMTLAYLWWSSALTPRLLAVLGR